MEEVRYDLSIYRVLWPNNTTGVNIKPSPGTIFGYYIFNTSASLRYVKLYDKATAPTVGTDTPVLTIPIPSTGGCNLLGDGIGPSFFNGIGIGVTAGVADNDTSAPAANDVVVNIYYQ